MSEIQPPKDNQQMPSTSNGVATEVITSRIRPAVVTELRGFAAEDDVTISRFIARLAYREVHARKSSEPTPFHD